MLEAVPAFLVCSICPYIRGIVTQPRDVAGPRAEARGQTKGRGADNTRETDTKAASLKVFAGLEKHARPRGRRGGEAEHGEARYSRMGVPCVL
ncbi:hypothetical protein OH77DRAFT_856513 [Trametes cingulata]|nr:hypothetical protein OH77DRAFT_856513 [Trametes cingulata]